MKNENEDSSSRLHLTTNLVYDDHVVLPDGVSVSFHFFSPSISGCFIETEK